MTIPSTPASADAIQNDTATETVPCSLPTDLLTAADAARRLGVAKSAFYEWLTQGRIAHHRLGRRIRVREADVADFFNATRVERVASNSHARRA
jgi:excisionase family DNA binding protein